jgi:fatty acid desaturase
MNRLFSAIEVAQTCTPPSAGWVALLLVVLGPFICLACTVIGHDIDHEHPIRNGAIGGIVGALIAVLCAVGVYTAFNADYNRCEQRQRITVTP